MTRRENHASDEVTRHGAVEMARSCEAGIVICVSVGEDGESALHFSRFGLPPDDDYGDAIAIVAAGVDRLLLILEADL